MITGLIILLYFFLFAVAIYNIVAEYQMKKNINAYICLQTAFILYYILIPFLANIFLLVHQGPLNGYLLRISNAQNSEIVYAFIYTVVAYITILITHHLLKPSKEPEIKPEGTNLLDNETNFSSELMDELNNQVFRFSVLAGMATLFIGVASELVIANSLGGIFQAIALGDKLRAFGMDSSEYIPQSKLFLMVLMVISLASTYFFVYAIRIKKQFILFILLGISVLASIFYLLINAGRLGILLFLLTFFIDFTMRKTKHPFILMGAFTLVVLVLLGSLDDLFFQLSYGTARKGSEGNTVISILTEFAFPYVNLLNVHKMNIEYGLRWGLDFVTWIVNIIPTRILGIFGFTKITAGYTFVTKYYSGANAMGGTPTDLLTFGIRQFGTLGVLVNSALVTGFCKYFDEVVEKIASKNFTFITLRISSIMFIIVPYADLDSFVRNRYDMILVLIFAIIVSKIRTIPIEAQSLALKKTKNLGK